MDRLSCIWAAYNSFQKYSKILFFVNEHFLMLYDNGPSFAHFCVFTASCAQGTGTLMTTIYKKVRKGSVHFPTEVNKGSVQR